MTTELKAEVDKWFSGEDKPKPEYCQLSIELRDQRDDLLLKRRDVWDDTDLEDTEAMLHTVITMVGIKNDLEQVERQASIAEDKVECDWQDDPDSPEGRADQKCMTCGSVQYYHKINWAQMRETPDLEAMMENIADRRLSQ